MAQTYNDAVPASTRDALEDLTAIRNNFAALKSCFSGSSSPPNPVAGMWWYDTTANMLKLRNEANNAWLDVYDFANQRVPLAFNCSRTVVGGTGITATGSLNGGNVTVALSAGGVGNTQVANSSLGAEKFQTGTDERTWVMGRIAGASVGAVGSYVFAYYVTTLSSELEPGDTVAGSSLRYAGITSDGNILHTETGLSGTWRCMGYALAHVDTVIPSNTYYTATLFLRIS